jgi:hypothetical protein
MKKLLYSSLYVPAALLGIALAAACPQPFPPTPPGPGPAIPDGGPATDAVVEKVAQAACANLARRGCPEGLRDNCEVVVQKAIDTQVANLRLECLIGAKTQEAVRACGTVSCAQSP